jgi:hypothetical protein
MAIAPTIRRFLRGSIMRTQRVALRLAQFVRLAGRSGVEKDIKEFRLSSGTGHSRGWRFDRGEIHER